MAADPARNHQNLEAIAEDHWAKISARMGAIRRLAGLQHRTYADVEDEAERTGVSVATLYRDMRRLDERPEAKALLGGKGGFPKGRSRLHSGQELIIADLLRSKYLQPSKPPLVAIWKEINGACEGAGFPPVSRATVISRLKKISRQGILKRRGGRKAAEAATPRPRRFTVEGAWDCWQEDHTLADVIVVDGKHRKPIGRAWVTFVIDVATRMVVGFTVGLQAPSTMRAGAAMDLAVRDKTEWLAARGLDYAWPVGGLPRRVHTDNGSDFRSRAFRRALENQGVEMVLRPPGRPHYGGHVERLIGTMMGRCRMLPGATHNSPMARGDYDSKGAARLTVEELELWFAQTILGDYHNTVHSALGMTPLEAWAQKTKGRTPIHPKDPESFRIDLWPERKATIVRQGINAFRDWYSSPELEGAFIRGERKVICKYDPDDLSRLHVRLSDGSYVVAPLAFDDGRPSTLWLYKATRRSAAVTGDLLSQAAHREAGERLRKALAESADKSQSARRQADKLRLAGASGPASIPSHADEGDWDGLFNEGIDQ